MTKKQQINLRFGVLAGIVGLVTISRISIPPLLGHPSNFAPMDALALFSGCYFAGKLSKFMVPLIAIWVSDLFVNYFSFGKWMWLYEGFYWQYGCYILIALLGMMLSHRLKPLSLLAVTLGSSVLFFLISNFGVWISWTLYPHTFAGLLTCYEAGLLFFRSTLVSDLLYTSLMFGVFELAKRKYPLLSLQR